MAAYPIHPAALQMLSNMGLDEGEFRTVFQAAADRLPLLMLGGYTADVAVAGAFCALHDEPEAMGWSTREWGERIAAVLGAVYAGLI